MSETPLFDQPKPKQEPAIPGQKPHWSISQISMFFSCAEKYRRHYLEKERVPSGVYALIGSGVHKAAEINYKQRLQGGAALTPVQAVEAAVEGFNARLEKDGVTLSDDEQSVGQDAVLEQARNQTRQFAAAFALYQAKLYEPAHVEKYVRIPVPRGSHDILGVLDLVTVDGRVRDWKTARRKKSSVSAAESLQLTTYAAGHAVAFGKPAKDVGLEVLIHTAKGVQRQCLTDTRDAKDFQVLANRINVVDQALKAGLFLPAALGDWSCSATYCPYHSPSPTSGIKPCPYVNSERIAAAKAAENES